MPTPADVHAALDAIDPRLWPLALALIAFGAVWALRRYLPKVFAGLPKGLQALPAVAIAAILGGASGADLTAVVVEGFIGAVSGIGAVGLHHAAKRLPGPYGAKS